MSRNRRREQKISASRYTKNCLLRKHASILTAVFLGADEGLQKILVVQHLHVFSREVDKGLVAAGDIGGTHLGVFSLEALPAERKMFKGMTASNIEYSC